MPWSYQTAPTAPPTAPPAAPPAAKIRRSLRTAAGILEPMKALAWISAVVLAACGGGPDPILRNVPAPNKAAVAGAAAAIAGAATLASPADAAKRQEKNKTPDEKKPIKVDETVPSDVLDRLDARQQPEPEPAPATQPAPPPVPAQP